MGNFANRTPVLGLNYGSEASENFNWSKLDEIIGGAFGPGSPFQLPPDVMREGDPAGGMLDGTYPNPLVRARTQLLHPFPAHSEWSTTGGPIAGTWLELCAIGPFLTRGGPIMLVANLQAYLKFTAQPTGTTAAGYIGWAIDRLSPPDVWQDQCVAEVVGGTGGTEVKIPFPTVLAFDQQGPRGITYHLMLATSDASVTIVSNGGTAWVYELA